MARGAFLGAQEATVKAGQVLSLAEPPVLSQARMPGSIPRGGVPGHSSRDLRAVAAQLLLPGLMNGLSFQGFHPVKSGSLISIPMDSQSADRGPPGQPPQTLAFALSQGLEAGHRPCAQPLPGGTLDILPDNGGVTGVIWSLSLIFLFKNVVLILFQIIPFLKMCVHALTDIDL